MNQPKLVGTHEKPLGNWLPSIKKPSIEAHLFPPLCIPSAQAQFSEFSASQGLHCALHPAQQDGWTWCGCERTYPSNGGRSFQKNPNQCRNTGWSNIVLWGLVYFWYLPLQLISTRKNKPWKKSAKSATTITANGKHLGTVLLAAVFLRSWTRYILDPRRLQGLLRQKWKQRRSTSCVNLDHWRNLFVGNALFDQLESTQYLQSMCVWYMKYTSDQWLRSCGSLFSSCKAGWLRIRLMPFDTFSHVIWLQCPKTMKTMILGSIMSRIIVSKSDVFFWRWLRSKGTLVVCHPSTWFGHGHTSWHGHEDMGMQAWTCRDAGMDMQRCGMQTCRHGHAKMRAWTCRRANMDMQTWTSRDAALCRHDVRLVGNDRN